MAGFYLAWHLAKELSMRILSICFILSLLGLSGQLQAATADGEVFYTLPSGEFVEREVTLEVPSRGEGEVVLRGSTTELRTETFFTVQRKGKTTFYIVFETTSPNGKKAKKIFRGTYIRGTNKAVYYGDIYRKSYGHGGDDDDHEEDDDDNDDWKSPAKLDSLGSKSFVGGFRFAVDIDSGDQF